MDLAEMRQVLKELEPRANDMLGDVGCDLLEMALDKLSKKFKLTEADREKLEGMLAVGVSFEIEASDAEIEAIGLAKGKVVHFKQYVHEEEDSLPLDADDE